MESTGDQQPGWTWLTAAGATLALFGLCTVYNWAVNFYLKIQLRLWPPASPNSPQPVSSQHPSKLVLPTFWVAEPAAWFVFEELRFQTNGITSQARKFDLLIAALPEKVLG